MQLDDSWLKDSIFWTTPRNRRTLEKRRTRRFGCPTWGVYFGPRLNKRIRVDNKTGEYFELGKLAPQTYTKVMDETRRIQKKMADTFGVGLPKDEDRKRPDYLEWAEYFMAVSFLSAMRSKDPATQVGACIVNPENRIVGIGYNGMPRGCSDDLLPWGKHSHDQ